MSYDIWLSSPHMSDEGYEKEFIEEAFRMNWIAPLGANVTGFEQELADKVGAKYAAALSSAAAIHMASAAGVGKEILFLSESRLSQHLPIHYIPECDSFY